MFYYNLYTLNSSNRRLSETPKVNLYQSHQHHHSQYTMGTRQRPHSAGPILNKPAVISSSPVPSSVPGPVSSDIPITHSLAPAVNNSTSRSLYDTLSKSFYVTSYQSQISQPANKSKFKHIDVNSPIIASLFFNSSEYIFRSQSQCVQS